MSYSVEDFVSETAKKNYENAYSYFESKTSKVNTYLVEIAERCLNKFPLNKNYSEQEELFKEDLKLAMMRGLDTIKKWQIMKYYSESPETANYEKAFSKFQDDIKNIIAVSKGFSDFEEFKNKNFNFNDKEME